MEETRATPFGPRRSAERERPNGGRGRRELVLVARTAIPYAVRLFRGRRHP